MVVRNSKSRRGHDRRVRKRSYRDVLRDPAGRFMAGPQIYNTLDSASKEIRVLELDPGVGNDIVSGTLKHVSLLSSPAPVYETISYCWGPPKDPATIKLNDCLVSVPHSSEAALRRMRLTDRSRVLWIDAICIDQTSISEKNEQVALMSDVYHGTKENLVYFGEDEARIAEQALKTVQLLHSEASEETNKFETFYQTIYGDGNGKFMLSRKGFKSVIDFEALGYLFGLPWFRVLQEATLPSLSTCYWGSFKVNLFHILRSTAWIVFKAQFISAGLLANPGLRCALVMSGMADFILRRDELLMGPMMLLTQSFQKTEPRDAIYGILGLCDKHEYLGHERAALLEVDYTKTLPAVIRDATRYGLCQVRDLRDLVSISHTFDQLKDGNFPSWALRPDLPHEGMSIEFSTSFNANMGLCASTLLGDMTYGPDILQAQGFTTDCVLDNTPTYDIFGAMRKDDTWFRRAKEVVQARDTDIIREYSMDVYATMAMTLVAGMTESRARAQPQDLSLLTEILANFDMHAGEDISRGNASSNQFTRLQEDQWRLLHVCHNRRFFITEGGRMGLGPRCLQAGDLVAILRGATIPFVLREEVNDYRLVGAAYVHGIMDGEAVKEWKARDEPETVFPIR